MQALNVTGFERMGIIVHSTMTAFWFWVQLTFSVSLCAQMHSEFCRKMIFQFFFILFFLP